MDKIEERLKDEVSNFVDLHPWDNSVEAGALYSGFHMVNESMKIIKDQQQEIKRLNTRPTNNEIEDAKESLRLYQDSNCELDDDKIDGIIGLIERLKGEGLEMKTCLESIYKHDLKQIDNLCDLARVHKFTLLRKDLERLLELPKAPEVG